MTGILLQASIADTGEDRRVDGNNCAVAQLFESESECFDDYLYVYSYCNAIQPQITRFRLGNDTISFARSTPFTAHLLQVE